MTKQCDNTSVGVIIKDNKGRVALLKRARFPVGIAPPAGHIDTHGTPEQAAIAEVAEELGLYITAGNLQKTIIQKRRVSNQCRRVGGDHHNWWVYEANKFEGRLNPDPDETKGAAWYDPAQLQELANRTTSFQAGHIGQSAWEASPGLEEIWLSFLTELGYVA
jgi:8-oxo-dGTP pyrophosphatase MutT (NUDIX family)